MPRFSLHTKFGTLAARGLYHVPFLRLEASCSSHNRQIARLPVETMEAAHFLHRFRKKEQPKWLFLKY